MGWKWYKFLRAATASAPAASSLGVGAPYYDTTSKRLRISDGTSWSDDTLQPGFMMPFGGGTAPDGFLSCDGSAVSRTTYAALFAKISTSWGVGDGSTTFNVPDLRETVPVGIGTRGAGVTAHDTFTIGQFKDDQGQGHEHISGYGVSGGTWGEGIGAISASSTASGLGSTSTTGPKSTGPIDDGTNGTPRTGTTTRTKQAGVLWCIKY